MLKYALLFLAAGLLLAGCKDNISTLGAQYYPDTVETRTSIRNDTGFIHFADMARPFVAANGVDYNQTIASPIMIVGQVTSASENLVSWGLLQFPSIAPDTQKMIVGVRLLLKDANLKYGDITSSAEDLRVSYCLNNQVTDSTLTQPTNLTQIGSIDTTFPDSADYLLPIVLDSAIIPQLTASSLAFVVTPGPTMVNCRGFGTMDNTDTSSVPKLELTLKTSNGNVIIYEAPSLDLHLVKDQSITPAGEFTLRGGAGARERITLNLTQPTDSAHLDAFSTINNATLVLHLDLQNSRRSNQFFDTGSTGPAIVQLSTSDSGATSGITAPAVGFRDPADPTNTTYRFQVRDLIEYWLRNPTLNFGFELRSGFQHRTIGSETIGVEDNTLNRWTFYSPQCSDATKRPYFILSYSKLH